MKHAFIFPGQGSQSLGMLSDLATTYPIVKQTFEEASEVLKFDLWALCQTGPEDALNNTKNTQPALLASGIAIWRIWNEKQGVKPKIMAGHSFGEYTALVCADAIKYTDAVSLAYDRGRFMQEAVPEGEGAMAAILGLKDEQIIEACEKSANGEVVSAVNFNAPGQVVIAGHKAAVERTMQLAKTEMKAKHAVMLQVSAPSHCILMKPAAERMAERLAEIDIVSPTIPVIHNVNVKTTADPAAIRQALTEQLHNPVRWVETIRCMAERGVHTLFKGGPGKVLTSLNKRIDRKMTALPLGDTESLEKALQYAAENDE